MARVEWRRLLVDALDDDVPIADSDDPAPTAVVRLADVTGIRVALDANLVTDDQLAGLRVRPDRVAVLRLVRNQRNPEREVSEDLNALLVAHVHARRVRPRLQKGKHALLHD